MARRAAGKSGRVPTFGEQAVESLRALLDVLDRGGRLEDHFTVEDVTVDAGPRRYGPKDVRALRISLKMSQALFARLLAVSPRTIQSWEQGASAPPPMARRLLEAIEEDPRPWVNRVFVAPRRRSA